MDMITVARWFLSLTEIFMYSLFLSRLTESKYSKNLTVLIILMLNILLFIFIGVLGISHKNTVSSAAYKITLFIISLIILLKFITKGSIKQIIKAIIIIVIFMFFSEFGGIYIYAASIGKSISVFINEWSATTPYFKMMGLYMFCSIFAASSSVYMIFIEKTSLMVKMRAGFMIALFFIFQMEILVLIYIKMTNKYSENLLFLGALNAILIITIYYIIQFVLVESLQRQEQKRELEFLKIHKERLLEYYELAIKYSDETKQIRDDIENQIQTIFLLFEDNHQSAIQMLSKVEKNIRVSKDPFYSGNIIVDTVLTIKDIQANNNNIDIEIIVGKIKELNIEDIDLCNLISNILDNAIEAVLKLPEEQRKIKVKIGERQGYLVVKCENAYAAENSNYNEKSEYEKINKKHHGYGLKIIKDITNKYDGEFSIQSNDNIFKATALIKII